MPVWRGCCPLALASRQWNESISGSVSSPTACFMGLFCNSPMSSVRAPFRQEWIKHLSSIQWHPAFIQGEEGWGQVMLVISDFCCILAQFPKVNETLAENTVCFGSWDYVPGVLLKPVSCMNSPKALWIPSIFPVESVVPSTVFCSSDNTQRASVSWFLVACLN